MASMESSAADGNDNHATKTNDTSATTHNITTHNSVRLYGSCHVECGYCKGARAAIVGPSVDPAASSKSYSVLASSLDPALYEHFLWRGWRRSGAALYKPDNWNSCCPALTIRLPVDRFAPTKSQRKVAKQMKRLLEPCTDTQQHHQHQQLTQAGGKRKDLTANSRIRQERIVQDSGILETLQEWTQQALLELLTLPFQQQPQLHLQPTYKIRKQHKSTVTAAATTTVSVFVTVATTICASIAGQSRGTTDRTDLAQRLAQTLSNQHAHQHVPHHADSSNNSNSNKHEDHPHNSKKHRTDTGPANVTIQSVQAHEPSGQVLVKLAVVDSSDGTKSEPPSDAMPLCDTTTAPPTDRLAEWFASAHHATNDDNIDTSSSNDGPHQQLKPEPEHLTLMPTTTTKAEPPYELTVKTLTAHESALQPAVHRLYFQYQTAVHNDADPYTDQKSVSADEASSTLASATWATKAPTGWLQAAQGMLRKEYHNLDTSRQERLGRAFQSFYEFLVENPFSTPTAAAATGVGDNSNDHATLESNLPPGSYHQHYRLAGVLVAVGVVDVLPGGLSSVYLFYDPSFAHELVPLGKYAILREIEWTQKAGLPYYYLGYYIESCPKMRYKADYHPSEVLCPTTYHWVDAEQAKETMLAKSPVRHCCTLYPNGGGNNDSSEVTPVDYTSVVDKVCMEVGSASPVTIGMIMAQGQTLVRPHLEEFVNEAGPDISLECTVNFS